jgi:glycosyltransferase involved in cell wall biosynthesis
MDMLKLSVIVPVYNAASTLDRCLESLIRQNNIDIEILLIDDGSQDESLMICQRFANLDHRIHVESKINGGVSSARNRGLKLASGDYVVFIDADDYIDDNSYNMLLSHIGNDIDVIIFGLIFEFPNFCVPHHFPDDMDCLYVNEAIKADLMPVFLFYGNALGKQPQMGSVCRMIFNRKLLQENDIRFDEQIRFCEDLLFCLDALSHASMVKIDKNCYYHYSRYIGTATENYMENLHHDIQHVIKIINEHGLLSSISSRYQKHPDSRFLFLLQIVNNLSKKGMSVFKLRLELDGIFAGESFSNWDKQTNTAYLTSIQKLLFYLLKYKQVFLVLAIYKLHRLIYQPIAQWMDVIYAKFNQLVFRRNL